MARKLGKLLRRFAKDDAPSMSELTELANKKKKTPGGAPPKAAPPAASAPSTPRPRNLDQVKSVDLFKSKMEETRLLNALKSDNNFPVKPAEFLIWRMIPNDNLAGGLSPMAHARDGMTWREAHSPTGIYKPEVKLRLTKFKKLWDRFPDSKKWLAVKKVVVNNAKNYPVSKEILTNYAKNELGIAHTTQGALVFMDKDPGKYGLLSKTVKTVLTPKFITQTLLPQIKSNKDIPGAVDQILKSEFPEVAAQFKELEAVNPDYANSIVTFFNNEIKDALRLKNETVIDREAPPEPSEKSETDRVLNQQEPPKAPPAVPFAAKPFSDFEKEFSSIVTKKGAKLKDIELIVKNMLSSKDDYRSLKPATAEMFRDKLTQYLKKIYVAKHAWNIMSSNNPGATVDMTQRIDVSNLQGQQEALNAVTGPMTPNQKAITGESVIKTLGNTAGIRTAIRSAIGQQDQNNQDAVAQALDPRTSFCSAFNSVSTSPHPDLASVAVNVDPTILSNLAGLPQPPQTTPTYILPQNAPVPPGAVPVSAQQLPQMVGNPLSLLSMNPQNMQGMLQMMSLNQAMGSVNRNQAYQANMAGFAQQIEAFKAMMESLKATVGPIWGDEITRRFEHEAYNTFMNKFMELFMMQTLSNQFGIPMDTMSIFTQQQMQQMNQQGSGGQAFVENAQGVPKTASGKALNPMQKFAVGLSKEMTQPTKASIVGLAQIIVTTAK